MNNFFNPFEGASGGGGSGTSGRDGRGISSIDFVNSEGRTDNYKIVYTDGTSSTFSVKNGEAGPQGLVGPKGDSGPRGQTGPAGTGITDIHVDANGHVIITLSNGSTVDAGKVPKAEVVNGIEYFDITIMPQDWNDGIYVYNNDIIGSEDYITIFLPNEIPKSQYLTVAKALIHCTKQLDGSIEFTVFGDVPQTEIKLIGAKFDIATMSDDIIYYAFSKGGNV